MKSKRRQGITGIVLCLALIISCGVQAQEIQGRQKKDSVGTKQIIKASEYLIPHRQGAEKFSSRKGVEHLFFSAGSGMGYLLDMGSGRAARGPVASLYAGNWITPVIGIRGGFDYGMWRLPGGTKTNLMGVSADYLVNLSAFAARFNPRRLFELVGSLGIGYRALATKGAPTIHTYGLRTGLQAKFNVSSAFNLFIEPQLMLYPDRVDNAYSWRRFDLNAVVMVGITFKPSGFAESTLLSDGFASLAVGTANTGGTLLNTEMALGKWLDEVSGIRISAGSSTSFLKKVEEGSMYDAVPSKKDFNISLNADYLCNLSNLFARERRDRMFSVLFVAGIGSYFPGSDATEKIVINGRFGFQGNLKLSRHYSAWLEPRMDLYRDNTERKDMQKPLRGAIGLMAGISYQFK